MRDSLCKIGLVDCQVDGHINAGHTTRNPFVVRFLGNGRPQGGLGGHYIIDPPGTKYAHTERTKRKLWDKWRAGLKGELQYTYPMMTTNEIVAQLEGEQ
jgi:hypothetical protein